MSAQKQDKFEASFSTLVLSIGSSAMMSMGLAANPSDGRIEKNLPMARFNIDLLEVLKAKTKGNLTTEEEKFLNNLISDLKMKYLQSTSPGAKQP